MLGALGQTERDRGCCGALGQTGRDGRSQTGEDPRGLWVLPLPPHQAGAGPGAWVQASGVESGSPPAERVRPGTGEGPPSAGAVLGAPGSPRLRRGLR